MLNITALKQVCYITTIFIHILNVLFQFLISILTCILYNCCLTEIDTTAFCLQVTSKFAVFFITVQYNVTISTNGRLTNGVWGEQMFQCSTFFYLLHSSHLDSKVALTQPCTNPFQGSSPPPASELNLVCLIYKVLLWQGCAGRIWAKV